MNSEIIDLATFKMTVATVEEALRSIDQYNVVIIKNAFDAPLIEGFLSRSFAFGDYLEQCMQSGTEPELSSFHAFAKVGLACNITALDPQTSDAQISDLAQTSLYQAIATNLIKSILKKLMGTQLGWTHARVRLVLPKRTEIDGRLALHLEKAAIHYPNAHNVWTPLTKKNMVANKDIPGIQFLLGKKDFFRNEPQHIVDDFLSSLHDQADGEIVRIDATTCLYRPMLQTGDLAIFNGNLPHGGHMPSGINASRLACDFRLFPWTETDYSNGNLNLKAAPLTLVGTG